MLLVGGHNKQGKANVLGVMLPAWTLLGANDRVQTSKDTLSGWPCIAAQQTPNHNKLFLRQPDTLYGGDEPQCLYAMPCKHLNCTQHNVSALNAAVQNANVARCTHFHSLCEN